MSLTGDPGNGAMVKITGFSDLRTDGKIMKSVRRQLNSMLNPICVKSAYGWDQSVQVS